MKKKQRKLEESQQTRINKGPAKSLDSLPEPQRIALQALASGKRYKDAARLAGVKPSTVYAWQKAHREAFNATKEARYLPLADLEVEALEKALTAADPDKPRSIGNALKAAALVQRGLGIGTYQPESKPTHAGATQVIVNVDLGGVLRATTHTVDAPSDGPDVVIIED
tara:strand:- start:32443 stop:32946 length:504 start_codon:yes stop_codon:yes gene_type:complete